MILTRVETIGPKEAAVLLEANTNNRPVSQARVDAIARAMVEGAWLFHGASIQISEQGVILDGQHRLIAVVKTGLQFKFVVVRGVADEAFKVIDCGKSRSVADVLHIDGYTRGTALAASLNLLVCYAACAGGTIGEMHSKHTNGRASRTEILALARAISTSDFEPISHPALAGRQRSGVSSAAWLFGQHGDIFIQRAQSGADLAAGSAELALLKWLATAASRRAVHVEHFAATLIALSKKDHGVTRISVSKDTRLPIAPRMDWLVKAVKGAA